MKNTIKSLAQTQNDYKSVLQFHGSHIAFEKIEGKMMVNATQMAKPFGKQPIEWLRFQQAQDLLEAMTKLRNHSLADLKHVRRGGNNAGTWFHEDVALLFAQWLSPEFYIACNDKLKELLRQQAIAIPETFGVPATIHNGETLYPYNDACKILGGVKYPKASKRKAAHPQHFRMLFGRNFITEQYLKLMKGYYDYKNSMNQLKLSL